MDSGKHEVPERLVAKGKSMKPPKADDRTGSTIRQALRRHGRLVLAVPATFALAAFFAVSLVPPVYRVSIELRGDAGLAERWQADAPASMQDEGTGSAGARPNLSALRQVSDWIDGDATLSQIVSTTDRGIRTEAPDRIVVWVEAGSARAAGEQADAIADLVARSEAMAPGPAAAPAPDIEPTPLPVIEPVAAVPAALPAWSAVQEQARGARTAAAASMAALDAFLADPANGMQDGDAAIGERLSDAQARSERLRTEGLRLRAAAREARTGSVQPDAGPPVEAVAGWADLERLARQRRDLGASVDELGRTLLDGHPRMAMARLRLADLDGSLRTTGTAVARTLDEGADARADQAATADREADRLRARRNELADIALRRAALERQMTLDADVAGKLEAALAASEPTDAAPEPLPTPAAIAPPEPELARAAPAVELTRTLLPMETLHPSRWPTVAGSALAGLALALLGVAATGLRRGTRPPLGAADPVVEPLPLRRPVPKTVAGEPGDTAGLDIATVDDVIDALITSGISRALLMVPMASPRPVGVDIVRRLALRGQSAAIVDLSEDQTAARAMGAGDDAPGITDLIEGDATFAGIARRDFATRADIVPGGRHPPTSKLDTIAERRNVLDFIERSYETLLIDCGRMSPAGVKALSDTDAALLMAVQGASADEVTAAVRDLREAGLDDVILVGDTRSVPA